MASGSRTSGSNLWMLRKALSGPSSRSRATPASGLSIEARWPMLSRTNPSSRELARNSRCGARRSVSPLNPTAATMAVATMAAGATAKIQPAGQM